MVAATVQVKAPETQTSNTYLLKGIAQQVGTWCFDCIPVYVCVVVTSAETLLNWVQQLHIPGRQP